MAKRTKRTGHAATAKMAKAIDDLADFEEFKRSLLPILRQDLKSGMSAKEILKKHQSLVAAKLVHDSVMAEDVKDRAAISKYVIDQGSGKATETVKNKHEFEDLSDDEVAALLASKLNRTKLAKKANKQRNN